MATFGIDYLTDYYAVLGVARDTPRNEIRAAYVRKQMQYHTDRFPGLAPELLADAAEKSKLLSEAYAIVGDDDKRRAYDEQLANWTGPLSVHGGSIIILGESNFSLNTLLEHLTMDPETRKREAENLALQYSGFDKETYEFFRTQAKSPAGIPPALKAAYFEQLSRRDTYLALLESFIWESMGQNEHTPTPHIEYGAQATAAITAVRAQAHQSVRREVLSIAAGERALLPAPDGMGEKVDAGQMLAYYTARLDEHFAQQTTLLEPIVAEREEILTTLFDLGAQIEYHPDTTTYTDRVMLGMLRDEEIVWRLVVLDGNAVRILSLPDEFDRSIRSAAHVSKKWLSRGYTVLTFRVLREIDVEAQLNRIADLHAMKRKTQA